MPRPSGRAAPAEDQPRPVPTFLKAHSRQPAAATEAASATNADAFTSSGGQAAAAATGAGRKGGPTTAVIVITETSPPAPAPVGASSSSAVVMPALPVPYWSRGRNARLGNKELLVLQVRQALLPASPWPPASMA